MVFGSNIKSINLFLKKLDLNYQGIWTSQLFVDSEPNTIFKNILCLPKASFLKINTSKFEIKKYKIKNYFLMIWIQQKKILSVKEIVESSVQEKLYQMCQLELFEQWY